MSDNRLPQEKKGKVVLALLSPTTADPASPRSLVQVFRGSKSLQNHSRPKVLRGAALCCAVLRSVRLSSLQCVLAVPAMCSLFNLQCTHALKIAPNRPPFSSHAFQVVLQS